MPGWLVALGLFGVYFAVGAWLVRRAVWRKVREGRA